ncbi:hypothetical protein MSMEI_0169 [Mycolicibacterium smegmatis MC2 155]|uniref:Uncharacterized protein n=1 Tax=Mycolicibacterium smegmatis (strain ATCC 700084 / mc(2)155) TaxID=246196 RepID=I7F4U8_MYCS2|nr:hypothetical protein MSMEI_0169 [Mycolicibacterium smegmatis MC2 155]
MVAHGRVGMPLDYRRYRSHPCPCGVKAQQNPHECGSEHGQSGVHSEAHAARGCVADGASHGQQRHHGHDRAPDACDDERGRDPCPRQGAAVAHRGFDGAGSAPVCDHEPERDNCGRTEGDCGDGILPENNGSADQREDGHERQQRPAPGQPGAFDL